jgi:tetratricopeptide (TPR) repeat protein
MKRVLIVLPIVLASWFAVKAQVSTQTQPRNSKQTAQQEARLELNAAARAYVEGRFVEAQQHSERALALDPTSRTAPIFVARAIHAQYKPGDFTEENVAKTREAIEAYQRILQTSPQSEEAYKAIAYLYAATKQEELLREWLMRRALDGSVVAEKRAEAFTVLASKDWDCSFKITELPANHTTILTEDNKATIEYRMPSDPAEFEAAKRCAERGMQMVEAAIGLSPEDESAWSYKTNILLELAKIAEMNQQPDKRDEYRQESNAAQKRTTELAEKNRRARE